jgi:hypothetical protein
MIERSASASGRHSTALYSPCLRYRYGLSRVWEATGPGLLFVMLNPSTADEHRNDPTIARCEARARRLGFGGVRIANLFAFRATRPAELRRAADPVGPENDALLRDWSRKAALVVAAWGVHGSFRGRDRAAIALLGPELHHLGLTRAGHPRHPLYVRNETPLERFVPAFERADV